MIEKTHLYLILFFSFIFVARAENKYFQAPSCLASFCVLEKKSLNSVIDKYGFSEGSLKKSINKQYNYCYLDSKQKVFIVISGFKSDHWREGLISEVSVYNKKPSLPCEKWHQSKIKFPLIQTPEKIRIGDSKKKVLTTYGRPARDKISSDKSTLYFSYSQKGHEVFYVTIYFIDNKVSGFHLVNSF